MKLGKGNEIILISGGDMYNKILVPLDGSEFAECALRHVKEIGAGGGCAGVVLLTVLEPVKVPMEWLSGRDEAERVGTETEANRQQAHKKAGDYLDIAAASLKQSGIPVETVIIDETLPQQEAATILDYAQDHNFDLIVMSTHGRSGISRWAFGSVADKIVHHARVPVLSVTPEGCRL
jgi:nucleotide-binding universal stress UspA family protein